jgi:TrmH family RNA methyltransferase
VFVAGEGSDAAGPLELGGAPLYAVTPKIAAKLSTLETPPRVMAVFPLPETPAPGELRAPARAGAPLLAVYTDRLADPGNMGTLVRAAAAFAAAALVASPGSVDLFSPKVVRASMGAVFALPLYQDVLLERAAGELGADAVYGLVARGGAPLDELRPARAALLCVGAERAGLSDEVLARVTDLVTIPLAGAGGVGVESLNAGVAGAIALYEFTRRREPGGGLTEDGGAEQSGSAPHKE